MMMVMIVVMVFRLWLISRVLPIAAVLESIFKSKLKFNSEIIVYINIKPEIFQGLAGVFVQIEQRFVG